MTEIILYIASSLDGYIADRDGGVSWLEPFNQAGGDYGYAEFLEQIRTLLMGGRTYRQVLDFGEWPYPGKRTIVLTHQGLGEVVPAGVESYSGEAASLLNGIRAASQGDVWLVGGGDLIAQLIRIDAIDEYRIFIMPVLLGAGVPLFPSGIPALQVDLETIKRFDSGVVELRYRPIRS